MGVPGQGTAGKARGGGAERGLLTVFKAVALKIIQAPFLEPLGHHTAPQDSRAAWAHQAANEAESRGRPHLLRPPGC